MGGVVVLCGSARDATCSWRELAPHELALAWPLARLFGAGPDLAAWRTATRAWLSGDARRRLGALFTARGVIVALARYAARGSRPEAVLDVPWLAALEVTPEPRYHLALLSALASRARSAGCASLRLSGHGPSAAALAAAAARLRLHAEPDGWRWWLAAGAAPVPSGPSDRGFRSVTMASRAVEAFARDGKSGGRSDP
ncbi:MAG: hypothetical protein RMK73_09860 [Geminicoccaceae bacterium]|nr:hypothetical protein [Geminicoccaceae bacterium]MDW8341774.1 hypothetical protein [Geminicoccaceae bacterium]